MKREDILSHLTKELLEQDFRSSAPPRISFDWAKQIAMQYAIIENSIAVLSNLITDISYICYGKTARLLDINSEKSAEEVPSIWEKSIIDLINDDDFIKKQAQELKFLAFVKSVEPEKRADYFVREILRMKKADGEYAFVCHRIYYLDYDESGNVCLALCLYNIDNSHRQMPLGIINSMTGEVVQMEDSEIGSLLSGREQQILQLISHGKSSKEIAEQLFISNNTVNRHRQNILAKLHASNSAEALKIAGQLGII